MLNIVRISVPERLDFDAVQTLQQALNAVPPGGVAVLHGSAGCFCAGLHLESVLQLDATALRAGLRAYADLLLALRTRGVPTLAVLEGPAYGGGVGLAAACDGVLALPTVRLGLPECIYGFHPAIVLAVLDQRMSPQAARRLALQGDSITAAAALGLGLVDEIVDADALPTALQRLARRLGSAEVRARLAEEFAP